MLILSKKKIKGLMIMVKNENEDKCCPVKKDSKEKKSFLKNSGVSSLDATAVN